MTDKEGICEYGEKSDEMQYRSPCMYMRVKTRLRALGASKILVRVATSFDGIVEEG